ncbi:MAG: MarR family winged helix-turn-helix transcriptional regulator [Thermoleophilia bacterium]
MTQLDVSKKDSMELLAREIRDMQEIVKFDSLLLLLYAAEVVSRFLESRLKEFGHDQTRLNILYLLVASEGTLTPTEISDKVYRSKHAITRAIDILEKAELVTRERSPSDRRSINVTISEKGIDLVRRSLPKVQQASAIATSCLTSQQVEELKSTTRKLRHWISASPTQ